tara:strand:+ start:159 stop:569 length:411 start_codon:yes stop_codon:yes gene_type:complete
MRFLTFILILFTTINLHAIEQDQLISKIDLDFLFDNNVSKWNQSVVFFDKKQSMSKVNSDDEIYSLKSKFKNGSVTIKPYFNKNKVIKIDLKYEFENFEPNINNLIFKHYTKLENIYCTNILNKTSIIIIEINKCN